MHRSRPSTPPAGQLRSATLWIDGVGSWLIWLPERLTIGGPKRPDASGPSADLPLLADLQRHHAAIERTGEAYSLRLFGRSAVDTDAVSRLRSGDEISLGTDVRLRFGIPSPLSVSATVEFASPHRPAERIDGIVLLEQACVIGPADDHHIHTPRSETTLVLFRREGGLWCRSPQPWRLQEYPVSGAAPLYNGCLVATESLQFRVEMR